MGYLIVISISFTAGLMVAARIQYMIEKSTYLIQGDGRRLPRYPKIDRKKYPKLK